MDDIGQSDNFHVEMIFTFVQYGVAHEFPADGHDEQTQERRDNKQNCVEISKRYEINKSTWKSGWCIRPTNEKNQHGQE